MVAISGRESELPFDTTLIRGILEHWHGVPGNLMPILHEIQDLFGYIPPESVPHIARALNQSRAEVHGVISFYHDSGPRRPVARSSRFVRQNPARRWAAAR